MKKNLLYINFFFGITFTSSFVATAQTPRVQLFEYFDDCEVPTAGLINKYFDGLEQANTGKMISIKYHVDLGSGLIDTMYLENPVQNQLRFANTYNLFQIPSVVQDGGVAALNLFSGVPYTVYQPSPDARSAVTSPFSISVSHILNAARDSMLIHTAITKTGAASGTFYGQTVVIERRIHFNTPPGLSGEVNFENVCKSLLPTNLPPMNTGDSIVLNQSWKLIYVHDTSQLAVVSFVQSSTLEVMQATMSPPAPKLNDASVLSVNAGIPPFDGGTFLSCDSISPHVVIYNAGSNVLSSCSINSQVNNGTASVYAWTGILAPNASENVTLPSVFNRGLDSINVFSTNPNGSSDPDTYNDTTFTFFTIPSSPSSLSLTEGFESAFPPAGWEIGAPNYIETWQQYAVGGKGMSSHSARLHFFDIPAGEVHNLYAPAINLSTSTDSVHLIFNVAYARFNYQLFDSLNINVSTDCGASWTTVYSKGGLSLKTAPDDSSLNVSFVPTASQWRQDTADLTPFNGQPDVLVEFSGKSGFGNNLYIDDINISIPVGIESYHSINNLSVYPNPSQGNFILASSRTINNGMLEVYNAFGERILLEAIHFDSQMEINLKDVADGFYFLRISDGEGVMTKKVIIQH